MTDTNEFENLNRSPSYFGASNVLLSVPEDAPERYGSDIATTTARTLPPMRRGPHLEYRIAVVNRFQEHAYEPEKKKGRYPFRTKEQARLDRAFTAVAECHDRTEPTIREACTRAYDGESPTDQFRQHCKEVMQRVS